LLTIIKVATAFHSYFSKASFQKITRFYLLRRRSLDISTCDLLLNRNSSFHGVVGRRLAVGHFEWQASQSRIHYQTAWEIQSWL